MEAVLLYKILQIRLFAIFIVNVCHWVPQVHKWVNVESTLKACYVGPLKASSPGTQRRNSANIVKKVLRHRDETLAVPKTVIITDG